MFEKKLLTKLASCQIVSCLVQRDEKGDNMNYLQLRVLGRRNRLLFATVAEKKTATVVASVAAKKEKRDA